MEDKIIVAQSLPLKLPKNGIRLFPTEHDRGIQFTREELTILSKQLSSLYELMIESLACQFTSCQKIPTNASLLMARYGLVPLIHCFVDRLLRLDRLVKQSSEITLKIAAFEQIPSPQSIEEFQLFSVDSDPFNQSILCHLAPIWSLPVVSLPLSWGKKVSSPQRAAAFKNYNFGNPAIWKKVKKKLLTALTPQFLGRIPALGMEYATLPLRDHFFYGSYLSEQPAWKIQSLDHHAKLREQLLGEALDQGSFAIRNFLSDVGIQETKVSSILSSLRSFVIKLFPSNLLEASKINFDNALNRLRPYAPRPLLFCGVGNTRDLFTVAAARALKMETIGLQHGGSYGYLDDYTNGIEIEYPYCDRFITFGWSRFPDRHCCAKVQAIPLPDPWLSVRKKQWQQWRSHRNGSSQSHYDLLFMTDKIYRFPFSPSGAASSRSDHIHRVTALLKELVTKAAREKISILHKPFNTNVANFFESTYREMTQLGEEYYQQASSFSKGLTPDLLEQAPLVLWDVPGTGFLECLAGEIPTVVLWPRIYSKEVPWARPLFEQLEAEKIIFRQVDPLIAEVKKFKSDPQGWLKQPKRQEVLSRFAREYGWAENTWPTRWRQFLKSLLT